MPSLLVSWPCLCVCLFPPESLQALATAVLCNHLCNSAQHHSLCIFCHCMGQLKTHLMLYTWFPELLPVYCPLLPGPLANIHVVLLCYRWVGASHRVPGPQLSSRHLQFHRTEVLGSASAKTTLPIRRNIPEASLATRFFSLHKHGYHCTNKNVQTLGVNISRPNTIRSHLRDAEQQPDTEFPEALGQLVTPSLSTHPL